MPYGNNKRVTKSIYVFNTDWVKFKQKLAENKININDFLPVIIEDIIKKDKDFFEKVKKEIIKNKIKLIKGE